MFNWFKKKSPAQTLKSEKSNPIQLDQVSDQAALQKHANDDTLDIDTRIAAIGKLKDINVLLQLGEKHAALLPAICSQLTSLEPQWLSNSSLNDSFKIGLLGKHEVSSTIKETLVNAIHDRSLASAMLKQINNKPSQQLLRAKIKELTQLEKDNAATIAQAEQLTEKLSHLATLPWNSQLSGKLIKLKEHWADLDENKIPSAISTRFQGYISTCETTLEHHKEEQDKIDAEHAHTQSLAQCIDTLEAHITQLKSEPSAHAETSVQLLTDTAAQWDTLNESSAAEAKLTAAWTALNAKIQSFIAADSAVNQLDLTTLEAQLSALQASSNTDANADTETKPAKIKVADTEQAAQLVATLKATLKANPWPQWLPASANYQQAEKLLQQAQAILNSHNKAHNKALQHIRHKNHELGTKLAEKNLVAASRLHFYINNKIDSLPKSLQDESAAIMEKNLVELKKLEDLNDFATEPKKIELCDKMEKLCSEDQHSPEDRANIIQAIQAEWKASNPIAKDNDPLWLRFSEAANKAWEPCAAFYADNQKAREANVASRQEICDQLSTLLSKEDWEKTDWKSIIQVTQVARKEWRQYEPVDFKLNTPVQKNFYKLLDQLNDKIKQQQEVLLTEKEDIIRRAEELSEVELSKAIETCKFLQQRWKNIGTLKQGEDSAHWKRFRKACDDVFARLDEKRQTEKESRNVLIAKADDIIKQVQQLAVLNDDELLQSREQLNTLKAQYEEIEDLPENIAERKNKELQKSINAYEAKIDAMLERKSKAVYENVFRLSLLLNEHEQSPSDKQKENIEQIIAELKNSNLKTALKKTFKRYEAPSTNENAIAELELLALEYEILASIETPEAYKAQRMEFQLKQLTGNATDTSPHSELSTLTQLDIRWSEIANVKTQDRAELEARRAKARSAINENN